MVRTFYKTVACAALLCLANSVQAAITATDPGGPAILSGNSIMRTATFLPEQFEPGFLIPDVNVTIEFSKESQPNGRPFYSEIHFVLTSPDNKSVSLILNGAFPPPTNDGSASFNAGEFNASFNGTVVFSTTNDETGVVNGAVNADPSVIPNSDVTGLSYQPVETNGLDKFIGDSPVGTWTLLIGDLADDVDVLSYRSFSVSVVPEPSSFALVGLGLLGAVARRRRSARLA